MEDPPDQTAHPYYAPPFPVAKWPLLRFEYAMAGSDVERMQIADWCGMSVEQFEAEISEHMGPFPECD